MKKINWNILDKKRLKMLPQLEFLRKDFGFYLAGGTALALQIGHRTSVDFDFYSPRNFDPKEVFDSLKKELRAIKSIRMADGTLVAQVKDVGMSFFRYEYPLIKPLMRIDYIDLLSIEDIAAMKLIAIVQRGVKRDFVDVYYVLKIIGLDKIIALTEKKYQAFNKYIGLRALTYFQDAEENKGNRKLELMEKINWDKIKKEIARIVNKYTLDLVSKG